MSDKVKGNALKERAFTSLGANKKESFDAIPQKTPPYISFVMDAAEADISSKAVGSTAIMQNKKKGLSFEVEQDMEKKDLYHITLIHDDEKKYNAIVKRDPAHNYEWYVVKAGIDKITAEETEGYIRAASTLYSQQLVPAPKTETDLASIILLKAEADGVLIDSGKELGIDDNINLYVQHVDEGTEPEYSCLLRAKEIILARYVFRRQKEKSVSYNMVDEKIIHGMPENVIEIAGNKVLNISRRYISGMLADECQNKQTDYNKSEEGIFRDEAVELDGIFAGYGKTEA